MSIKEEQQDYLPSLGFRRNNDDSLKRNYSTNCDYLQQTLTSIQNHPANKITGLSSWNHKLH